MYNYVIFQHYCHYNDVIASEWYLISFLMIFIVFLFYFRGKPDYEHEYEKVR